jgi:hypothetical protein
MQVAGRRQADSDRSGRTNSGPWRPSPRRRWLDRGTAVLYRIQDRIQHTHVLTEQRPVWSVGQACSKPPSRSDAVQRASCCFLLSLAASRIWQANPCVLGLQRNILAGLCQRIACGGDSEQSVRHWLSASSLRPSSLQLGRWLLQ